MSEILRPEIGVGVLVFKEGKVLMSRRLNAHGDGSWGLVGGHLEYGESFVDCAYREVSEEVGLQITEPTFAACTNDIFEAEQKHYVTIFLRADWVNGEPQTLEPTKLVEWGWFAWDALPKNIFLPIQNLIASGYTPDPS